MAWKLLGDDYLSPIGAQSWRWRIEQGRVVDLLRHRFDRIAEAHVYLQGETRCSEHCAKGYTHAVVDGLLPDRSGVDVLEVE